MCKALEIHVLLRQAVVKCNCVVLRCSDSKADSESLDLNISLEYQNSTENHNLCMHFSFCINCIEH